MEGEAAAKWMLITASLRARAGTLASCVSPGEGRWLLQALLVQALVILWYYVKLGDKEDRKPERDCLFLDADDAVSDFKCPIWYS